jgi:CDP-diacylglycerol--inositol 3-phosphatidyltransferase
MNPLLFVPNIIGYVRIILLFAALYNCQYPLETVILYSLSGLLDALDGYCARYFNQCS